MRKSARALALVVVAIAIAWATLRPLPASNVPPAGCLLCGARALADAALNVVMFLPVGALLGSALGPIPTVLLGAALSAAIEGAQLAIPGRDATIADVLANTLGTGLGLLLVRTRRSWLAPGGRRGDVFAAGWAALVVGVVFLTGWLLQPMLAHLPYTVQWTPALPEMEPYRGRITDAVIGDTPLRPGPVASAAQWAQLLAHGTPIALVTVLGPEPSRLAPLLTVHDAQGAAGILIGIRGDDLVLRRQTRAHRWRLDAPELSARAVLRDYAPGNTVVLATVTTPAGQCFIVTRRSHCGIGHDAGDGWRLFYSGESLSPATGRAMNALWAALLVLPIGFWARRRTAVALVLVIAWYGWLRVAVDTVLVPAGGPEAAGLVIGLAGGMLLGLIRATPVRRDGAGGTTHRAQPPGS